MNVITIAGRLTADIEQRTTTSGKAVASFTVAVRKESKVSEGEDDADFIRCTAWEGQAEYLANYSTGKGGRVVISGRLTNRKWQDQEGKQRDGWEIQVRSVEVIDYVEDNNRQPAGQGSQSTRSQSGGYGGQRNNQRQSGQQSRTSSQYGQSGQNRSSYGSGRSNASSAPAADEYDPFADE